MVECSPQRNIRSCTDKKKTPQNVENLGGTSSQGIQHLWDKGHEEEDARIRMSGTLLLASLSFK